MGKCVIVLENNLLYIFFTGVFLLVSGFVLSFCKQIIPGTILSGIGLFIMACTMIIPLIWDCCYKDTFFEGNKVFTDLEANQNINVNSIFEAENNDFIETEEICSICLSNHKNNKKLKCCNYYAHPDCVSEYYDKNPDKNHECFICKNEI